MPEIVAQHQNAGNTNPVSMRSSNEIEAVFNGIIAGSIALEDKVRVPASKKIAREIIDHAVRGLGFVRSGYAPGAAHDASAGRTAQFLANALDAIQKAMPTSSQPTDVALRAMLGAAAETAKSLAASLTAESVTEPVIDLAAETPEQRVHNNQPQEPFRVGGLEADQGSDLLDPERGKEDGQPESACSAQALDSEKATTETENDAHAYAEQQNWPEQAPFIHPQLQPENGPPLIESTDSFNSWLSEAKYMAQIVDLLSYATLCGSRSNQIAAARQAREILDFRGYPIRAVTTRCFEVNARTPIGDVSREVYALSPLDVTLYVYEDFHKVELRSTQIERRVNQMGAAHG